MNVSLFVASGCDAENFFMKYFIRMMHPANFAIHASMTIKVAKPPDIPDVLRALFMNIYAAEISPSAKPA